MEELAGKTPRLTVAFSTQVDLWFCIFVHLLSWSGHTHVCYIPLVYRKGLDRFFTTVAPQMKHIPTSSFHLGDSMPKTDPSRRPPSMPNDKSSSPSRLNPLSALDFYSHHFSLDDLFCKQSSWKETVYKKYCINYSTLCFFDCIKKTAIRLKLYF